ncbi:MAG: hypothetical protein IPK57_18110, partial [Chitinophagaceae bacterium]|nr:hypothetical protein [Chitinophagaceae bacterium]
LSWLFIFSVSVAVTMLSENKKVEWEKRKRMADVLSVQTDKSSEMLMSIAIQYLDNDFLRENFNRFSDPENGKEFRDSIVTDNYRVILINMIPGFMYMMNITGLSIMKMQLRMSH